MDGGVERIARWDIYQFKFTRGSWEREEATKAGEVLENKIVKLISDTTIQFEIAALER